MRLKQFLSEDDEIPIKTSSADTRKKNIIKEFGKYLPKCDEYIKENKILLMQGNFLYRGIREQYKKINEIVMQGSRKPLGTNINIHKKIGKWFEEKFGINYRERAVFCQGINNQYLTNYGSPTIIFPCGDYEFCFSKQIQDLTRIVDVDWNDDPDDNTTYYNSVVELTRLIDKNLSKYIGSNSHYQEDFKKRKLIKSEGFMLTYIFLNSYWYSNLNYDIESDFDIERLLNNPFKNLSNHVEQQFLEINKVINKLMLISKSDSSFGHFLLAYLGFRDFGHLKEVLIEIGNDWMNTFDYKETKSQTQLKPLQNEMMVSCDSYLVIPLIYKSFLKEYLNENY